MFGGSRKLVPGATVIQDEYISPLSQRAGPLLCGLNVPIIKS